jgi:HK97 family phage prohead protease
MQHLTTLKAAVTEAAEEGTFTAYASAFGNIDRTGERVVKGAFASTIRRWRAAGRDVPLVWDHGRDAREVIGSVDSDSLEERDAGLFIEARLDIEDSELAREAWRSVKRGRISLSFGYLTEDEREGADGVKELTQLDLMEVTLTSVPANPDARVLSTKSVELPPELIGTSLDPAFSGEIPTEAQIDAEMKAIRSTRPIQITSFPC